jgi:hypothetical protein
MSRHLSGSLTYLRLKRGTGLGVIFGGRSRFTLKSHFSGLGIVAIGSFTPDSSLTLVPLSGRALLRVAGVFILLLVSGAAGMLYKTQKQGNL